MDSTVIQDDNLVCIHHRRDPLGDDDFSYIGQFCQRLADFSFSSSIYRAGGIVENQHLRLFQQGTGDTEPLLDVYKRQQQCVFPCIVLWSINSGENLSSLRHNGMILPSVFRQEGRQS